MAVLSILLAGREGNGKSSTGNSILNKKVFTPRSISSAGSDDMVIGFNDGRTVSVVDGLSVRDTSIDSKNNVLATVDLAEKAVKMFDNGFTAIVICLKYGVRFTSQERSALSIIRSLYGQNVIKNYGVIVMTNGDSFENDMEDDGRTFKAWCQEQTGDIQDLFKECGGRFLLFNNRTRNEGQVKDLMLKVAEIQSRISAYTMNAFKQAELGRRKLLVLSKLPELQQQTSNILDIVTHNLRKLDDSYYSPSNYLSELDKLKREIDGLKAMLEREDDATNSIGHIMLQISITEASISTKRERHLRKIELESQMLSQRSASPLIGNAPTFLSKYGKIMLSGLVGFVVFIIIMIAVF